MIDRPLEENEEIVGDKIAGLFYSEIPANENILSSARAIASSEIDDQEVGSYVLETTVGRLYSEKSNRRDYLANKLNTQPENGETVESALLKTDPAALTPEDAEQYNYFRILSENLYRYEVEVWKNEQSSVLGLILKQSPEKLMTASGSLRAFADKVTAVRDPKQFLSASLPEAAMQTMRDLGLGQTLSRFETIIDEAAYCRYIGNLAEIVSKELTNGTPKEGIAEIAAVATLRYKPLLIS